MARTDIHRPSAIEPADYAFVAFEFLKVEDLGDAMFLRSQREKIARHMECTGGTYSRHEHGGNCHVCGSVNAIYTALFHHAKSNTYVRTGLDCAEKLDMCSEHDINTFKRNVADARANAAGKAKAAAILGDKGLGRAWVIFTDEAIASSWEVNTLADIVGKLVQYGDLSEKQFAFLGRLVDKIDGAARIEADRKAARAIENADAADVPVGRVIVKGTVLTLKAHESAFGIVTKMLVKAEAGWKVWGTRPAALEEATKGAVVEFTATIEASPDDPKFGFFARPSKARLVEAAPTE